MRWVFGILIFVTLIIADQAWYRGYYMSQTAGVVRQLLTKIGH